MRSPPYIRDGDLSEMMLGRPTQPFLVRPKDYFVVDGDTVSLRTKSASTGRSVEAFSVRLDGVNAPEMPKSRATDALMRGIGIEPHPGSPGQLATDRLRALARGHALLIEPVEQENGDVVDRYGRLLARISISGSPGRDFDLSGALSVSAVLHEEGHAVLMRDRDLPPRTPEIVEALLRHRHDIDTGPSP